MNPVIKESTTEDDDLSEAAKEATYKISGHDQELSITPLHTFMVMKQLHFAV